MSSTSIAAPWQSGIRGARANLIPGLVLQVAALLLVLGYYSVPQVNVALSRLVALRERTGFLFGICSTGIFGGLLPFLYLHYLQRDGSGRPRYDWSQGAGLVIFWSYKGLEVDVWYRLQAYVFGTGHDLATIATKVLFDQFGYCPLLAVPVTTALYQAVDAHYNWRELARDIWAPRWYLRRALPVLISNLGVWIPAVAIIYALPTPLQLPLQNTILCFYTLVVAHQAKAQFAKHP